MKTRRDTLRARLHMGGERRGQLEPGGRQNICQPQLFGGTGQAGEEHGFGFGFGETRELGAVALQQLETAVAAPVCVDRNAGCAQLIDIAMNGAYRNAELLRQRRRAHPAAGLQQHKDRKQPAREHVFTLSQIHDIGWHIYGFIKEGTIGVAMKP